MPDEKFLEEIGLSAEADLNIVARLFFVRIEEIFEEVQGSYDEELVARTEQDVTRLCQDFFDYAKRWQTKTAAGNHLAADHPDAQALKNRALKIQPHYQHFLVALIHSMLHMTRFGHLLEIENKAVAGKGEEEERASVDLTATFERNRRATGRLLNEIERLREAHMIAYVVDESLSDYRRLLNEIYGEARAEKLFRRFRSNLRTLEFRRAEKIMLEVSERKKVAFFGDNKAVTRAKKELRAVGENILAQIEPNADILKTAEEKLYLSPNETDTAYGFVAKKLADIRNFTLKYYRTFMRQKLDFIKGLRKMLREMCDLEEAITLFSRLASEQAYPLKDIKAIRTYEHEAVDACDTILKRYGREPQTLLARSREAMEEVRQYQRDCATLGRLKIEETIN